MYDAQHVHVLGKWDSGSLLVAIGPVQKLSWLSDENSCMDAVAIQISLQNVCVLGFFWQPTSCSWQSSSKPNHIRKLWAEESFYYPHDMLVDLCIKTGWLCFACSFSQCQSLDMGKGYSTFWCTTQWIYVAIDKYTEQDYKLHAPRAVLVVILYYCHWGNWAILAFSWPSRN